MRVDGLRRFGVIISNAEGQTETMQYDSQNRQTLAVSFEGDVTQYVYDPNTGNLAQKLLYPSLSAYDNGQGTPSETVSYTDDAFGQVVEVDDTVGSGANAVTSVTTTSYDSQGNVLSVTSPQGTVSYAYDSLGRLVTTMVGQGPTFTSQTNYTYNALGQVATVTVVEQNGVTLATPLTTNYEYDLGGNLIQEDLPNGVVDQFSYDDMNQLTKETEDGPGNAPVAEYDYTYRADGLQATETDNFWFANNGQNVEVTNNISYTYDALDRLIDEAFVTNAEEILGLDPGLPSDVRQWESFNDQYFYDLDSNQVEKTTELAGAQTPDETITSTYDANDRILQQLDTTASGSTTTNFSYDNTEQTAETVYSGTPSALGTIQSSQQYQYDLQGRMSGVTITTYTNGATSQIEQLTYGYDDSGTRVSALDQIGATPGGPWTSQTLTEYLNDDNNFTSYSQVLRATQTDAATGQVQQVTEYSIGPQQISQTTTTYANGLPGTPTTLFFGFDGHGSVRLLFSSLGVIATVGGVRQLFNYDAYGNSVGFDVAQAATTVLYSGQQTDAATGLQYLRARYYSPTTGSFTGLDPFAGSQENPLSYNKYVYTDGDPANGSDPTGMRESDDRETPLTQNLVNVDQTLAKHVNQIIQQAVAQGNAIPYFTLSAIYDALGEDDPNSGLKFSIGFWTWDSHLAEFAKIGVWLDTTLATIPNGIAVIPFDQSRYRWNNTSILAPLLGVPWLYDQGTAQHGLAPTIRINGTLMGTDKWEHFFQQGYWLWYWSNVGYKGGGPPLKSDADRQAFSAYMEGDDSIAISQEQQDQFLEMARTFEPKFNQMGYYGSYATGVISHADESANTEGYKFYQKVYASLGGPPYVFKVTDYDTSAFNEINNPNTFVRGTSVNDNYARRSLLGVISGDEFTGGVLLEGDVAP
jgi:RHS repeat-associated protein